jgi:cysteate synthase
VDDYTIRCGTHEGLIRTEYMEPIFNLRPLPGMWKYIDWLPVKTHLALDTGPITYRSEGLASALGLKNLYISFTGYWPERGATALTCTFKELEALPTFQRLKEHRKKGVILASAGNTGRAFAYLSALTQIPVILVIPIRNLSTLWLPEISEAAMSSETIKLIALSTRYDYFDAISFMERLWANATNKLQGVVLEGGVRNIARRDGMGTVMLDYVATVKPTTLPDHYFQAVGSGVGAIAVWEAALRLQHSGRYKKLPSLHLAQNLPFTPMYNAWVSGDNKIVSGRDIGHDARNLVAQLYATMLSNRNPPYSVKGGVYDALQSTDGKMYAVTNAEARAGEKLFYEHEGIDIVPEAGVAVGALLQALDKDTIATNDHVLLNITGGGIKKLSSTYKLHYLEPSIVIDELNIELEEVFEHIT